MLFKNPLILFFCSVLFFAVLGFELRTYTLSHSTSPFWQWVFFRQGLTNYLPGWLQTAILLISAL
jgi:hypothetical protein